MKHSDTNHSENSFGIHLSNKSFSIADHQMSINNSNSNSVMISSMMSTELNPNQSTILSTALNTSRPNSAVLTKPNSISSSGINANMVGQLTYINPNNNTIKFVNLSKCQQLPNLNKESSNMMTNNAINVQFVTPILNNTSISTNDSTGVSHSLTKMENSSVSKASIVLTSASSQSISSNNSITCTRFILHSSQTPILPHGPVTIIPHHSDIGGGTILNNQLIKNARYAPTGTKQAPQPIRPITACTASSVRQPSGLPKQTISKISPAKSMNNYTINIPDCKNTIAIHDLAANRHGPTLKDQQRPVQKTTPITPINYTSSNIRLALTSNIPNSKVNINASKVQLISPKARKRSGSPVAIKSDGISKELLIESKDENAENPLIYNSQLGGGYSPPRKRARKQHLKGDNNKCTKLGANNKFENCSSLNNTKHTTNDKSISVPISIAPIITKFASITSLPKHEEKNPSTFVTNANSNPPIIIPLKTPIQICTSKTSSTVASIYTGHISANNSMLNGIPSISTSGTNFNQIQIITQNCHNRPIQLSPISGNNLVQSPSSGKLVTSFSPQKVIHIAPSKTVHCQSQSVKNEKTTSDLVITVVKDDINKVPDVLKKEALQSDVSEIKFEVSDDSNIKYSLFPYKYNWNARRSHFIKECDVKIKRTKTSSNARQSNSESRDENISSIDIDINDTRWRLSKARSQLLMQKRFDEENLRNFNKLKDRFDLKPQTNDDNDEPIFQKVCQSQRYCDPLPDQIDAISFLEFTDPKLFGISEDLINSHINAIATDTVSSQSRERISDNTPHQCSDSCIFYMSEVPAISQPQNILKIIDLIEGLIVKEKNIINKESEINEQCLRLLESSTSSSLSINRNHNQGNRVKILNGRRW